ncbi:MAG: type IV pilus twitching motility protein PilT [Desulfotomaculum sp.]|nr:type IV pilus twitching motility protein PilT [Desulfotomaculum sp.]
MGEIETLLRFATLKEASDVHLTTGRPPAMRLHGSLYPLDDIEKEGVYVKLCKKLLPADTERMAKEIMNEEQFEYFMATGEMDFSYSIDQVGRFRINAFKQRNSVAIAIRLIKMEIPTIEKLALPAVVNQLAEKPRGLVLVTGPTGSGKSTTLAAMIDLINSEQAYHIITLEDPIEYLHSHKKSIVNQREIGLDSKSFAVALRAAMREDPDVILIGEMRDLETISTAITAAETGHLVLATLHTTSASSTIDRIIDVFPPHQQQQVRMQLANTIQGVICQQLLPRSDGKGRVAALEILVATPAVRNLIRENKTHQIVSQIQTGSKVGMQTMDMCLKKLVQSGMINLEIAKNKAMNVGNLTRL